MTCPVGKRMPLVTIETASDGLKTLVYAASKGDCQSCSKRSSCPKNQMQKHGRAVSRRIEVPSVNEYHQKMKTAEGKAIYKQRAPIAEFPHLRNSRIYG